MKRSRRAAGKGFWGASRYWTERQRPPVSLASLAVVEREAAGLPRLEEGD